MGYFHQDWTNIASKILSLQSELGIDEMQPPYIEYLIKRERPPANGWKQRSACKTNRLRVFTLQDATYPELRILENILSRHQTLGPETDPFLLRDMSTMSPYHHLPVQTEWNIDYAQVPTHLWDHIEFTATIYSAMISLFNDIDPTLKKFSMVGALRHDDGKLHRAILPYQSKVSWTQYDTALREMHTVVGARGTIEQYRTRGMVGDMAQFTSLHDLLAVDFKKYPYMIVPLIQAAHDYSEVRRLGFHHEDYPGEEIRTIMQSISMADYLATLAYDNRPWSDQMSMEEAVIKVKSSARNYFFQEHIINGFKAVVKEYSNFLPRPVKSKVYFHRRS